MSKDWLNEVLGRLVSNTASDVQDALNGRPGARTFGVDDDPKAQAHKLISAQLIRERLDELLGADDEVRLHNVVGESYQKWFIARRDDLTNKLKKIEHEN